ncbi:extracellular calcium-sensing receptor-like [Engystomops pustulosus]|uniref:extracellular calcium-sensing receptor-like n=1 Tax=Engystomops pustulosus TaxID=76066 RepID=UPI003AFB37EF
MVAVGLLARKDFGTHSFWIGTATMVGLNKRSSSRLPGTLADPRGCDRSNGPPGSFKDRCVETQESEPNSVQILAEKESLPTCRVDGNLELTGIIRKGDVDIGGIFSVNYVESHPDLSFRNYPKEVQCSGFSIRDFQCVQTMIFATEEINQNAKLLPNFTLGYRIHDACYTHFQATRAALSLVTGTSDESHSCVRFPSALAIIGGGWSTQSIAISRLVALYNIPMVSYFSTCACLSNKYEYPTFLRTIPSDLFQSQALAQLVHYFNWTWIGLITEDNDYGQNAGNIFRDEAMKLGGCVAFTGIISAMDPTKKILQSLSNIVRYKVKVVLIIASELIVGMIFQEAVRQNVLGIQWIASEAWSTSPFLNNELTHPTFQGTIGFAIQRGDIKGLRDFLVNTHLSQQKSNPLIANLWEDTFNCSLNGSFQTTKILCTGKEDLSTTNTPYLDVDNMRISYNVYKAVYAIAHALHNMIAPLGNKYDLTGGTFNNKLNTWKLLNYLKRVNFEVDGSDKISFDQHGDPYPSYDLVNWQKKNDGSSVFVHVGEFVGNDNLKLKENVIVWQGGRKEIPVSVCSTSCPPGSRRAAQEGKHTCCFDCIPCDQGKISNKSNSLECVTCPLEYWSNQQRDACVLKVIDYISLEETLGAALFGGAMFGIFLSVCILIIFIHHRYNPIVRANNSHLSFCTLAAIVLCFLSSVSYLGQPSALSCVLRNSGFGITFAFCISCILGKTIVVIVAFNVQHPGRKVAILFTPIRQMLLISMCTAFQIIVCTAWNSLAPPQPMEKISYDSPTITLQCDPGSIVAFSLVLGYIGFLVCISFSLAFCVRNLPYHYNEAKFITFSMVIVSAVWVTMVLTYLSSPGKYLEAVEMFGILFSCYGLLICIFVPKCYMILLEPEERIKRCRQGKY